LNGIRRAYACVLWLALFLPAASPLYADIYRYIDSNGVLHFTNVPVSNGYHVYIKERYSAPETGGFRDIDSGRYDAHIARAARMFDVDFSLLKAMIRVESGFDPLAVSQKGATGLMQIMPDNYGLLNIKNPFDPWQNIMGGARYIKMMLQQFEDQLPLALAAYNAGPNAVEKYQRIPPYTETVNYVNLVLRHYQAYKKTDKKPKTFSG
jgi:soluble lytic murein transglycosylase-like protein